MLVAFAVDDALQEQGIGTRLLERLADIACEHGISVFEAEVLGHNQPMINVFHNCGFNTTQRRIDEGVEKIVPAITPTPAYEQRFAERSEKAAAASMRLLFELEVVAVIGASREREKIQRRVEWLYREGRAGQPDAKEIPPEGRVALSSQSGGLGLALLDYAAKPNLGISTFVRQQGRCLRQRFDPVLSRGPASHNPATFRFIQSRRLAPVAETIAQEANGEGGWALGSVSARLLQVARRPVTVVRVGAVGAPCATTGRG